MEFEKLKDLPEDVQFYGEIFQGEDREWRWHIKGMNHEIVEEPGEGFDRFPTVIDSYERFHADIPYRVLREAPPE